MRSKIQILSTETISGVSKTSHKPYSLTICQSVVYGTKQDGTPSVQVGELVLPQGMPIPPAGEYHADFEISVERDSKRIGARLVALTPTNPAAGIDAYIAQATGGAAPAADPKPNAQASAKPNAKADEKATV